MTDTQQSAKPKAQYLRMGVVRSVSGDKTISVIVNVKVKHPRYGKYVQRRTKLAVHDPSGQAGVGDVVEITTCRPVSMSKAWRLVRIVRPSTAR